MDLNVHSLTIVKRLLRVARGKKSRNFGVREVPGFFIVFNILTLFGTFCSILKQNFVFQIK